jgi:hypothetical protein
MKRKNVQLQTIFLLILVGALTLACESFLTDNNDPAKNNKAAYNKDLKGCREDYPEQGSGVHYRQWIGCMKLKGWK